MADSRDWRDWVRFAENDWHYALLGLELFPTQSAFSLQQATEKYLKAVLLSAGLEAPRTHELVPLLALIEPGPDDSSLEKVAARLISRLYPEGRYPGDLPEPTLEEAGALVRATGTLRLRPVSAGFRAGLNCSNRPSSSKRNPHGDVPVL